MTREGAVARRYAKALLALVQSPDREGVGEELERFLHTVETHPALRQSVTRPWIKGSDKRAILARVVERNGISPLVGSFLGLLAEKNRIGILSEILAAYRALVDLEAGRIRAEVRTAYPLASAERAQLAQRLGRAVGRTVLLDEVPDPGLLGGFRAHLGSLVLDASLKGQIESIRERLRGHR